jgi:two-component system, NtrC family, sensor histidine kinase PilS
VAGSQQGRLPTDRRQFSGEAALRRELYFFTLYRLLQAVLLAFMVFSPFGEALVPQRSAGVATGLALAFPAIAVVLFLAGLNPRLGLRRQAAVGVVLDIAAATLAVHTLQGLETAVALMLVVNIGAAALLLPLRSGLAVALAAGTALISEYLYAHFTQIGALRGFTESLMFAVTYLAAAVLCHLLGKQMRETHALAERRGADLANLSQLNELIIRRMRTGVLVVDAGNQVRLFNEAAWYLLGSPGAQRTDLAELAPELSRRLYHWRFETELDPTPIALAEDRPEVIPRFARLTVTDDLFLIFLDDTSLVSRRAEELTLSTLGRLSASIAHEIRNPLAAISYAAQLLEESEDIPDTDRRLVEIVNNHCQRMNNIVENVLNLSRRERARPEEVDLAHWVYTFVDEFRNTNYLQHHDIKGIAQSRHLPAMVDPQHLYQVVANLVQNAVNYGHLPGEPARITVIARQPGETAAPVLEVIDRGPGIPPKVAASIFEPFFTTHEHGTGLGLYLVKQLCEANQASVEYLPLPGGGSCFRITLAKPSALARTDARAA